MQDEELKQPVGELPSPTQFRYVTHDIEGIGGSIKAEPEDFRVVELPAYLPSGEGEHVYLFVEKRDVAHDELVRRVARAFGVDEAAVGAAGMKDRRAVTRQWLSVHHHTFDEQSLLGPLDAEVTILEASRHQNKLKTGHLYGNRFDLVIRDANGEPGALEERVRAMLEVLAIRGFPNYFGAQRFGQNGETLRLGVALVSGDRPAKLRKNKWLRRLAASAAQSAVFNIVLTARIDAGTAWTAMLGDRLNRVRERGQLFVTEETLDEAQRGIDTGALVATGPMPGPKMYDTAGAVAQMEAEACRALGLEPRQFDSLGKTAPGTRRDLFVHLLDEPTVAIEGPGCVSVGFSLPSGAYATVVLAELTKRDLSAWEAP